MAQSTFEARVYFQDEAPRIGSGWRTVYITFGWKWARMRCKASGRGVRVKREIAEAILCKGEKAPSISTLMLGRNRTVAV